MELRVLNKSFIAVGIVDSVESLIWVERYSGFGEFEIYVAYSEYMRNLLQEDYYLVMETSNKAMIIESITVTTHHENGNKLLVKGRSLASILDRRVVMHQLIVDGSFQTGIQTILNSNVIASIYPERNIPGFVFEASGDPAVTGLTLKAQFYYEGVYDLIKDLCDQAGLGFKVLFNASHQFVFSLYSGVDRSYAQSANSYVVFSPNFDNLIKSDYFHTKRYKKNYVLMRGDPASAPPDFPGYPLRGQAWTSDVGPGLDRREMFLDASDVSIYLEGTGNKIPDSDYINQLNQRGLAELAKYPDITMFEGEVELTNTFQYGVDFNLGDLVQLVDEFGNSARAQVLEMTFSEDLSGSKTIPTLKTV